MLLYVETIRTTGSPGRPPPTFTQLLSSNTHKNLTTEIGDVRKVKKASIFFYSDPQYATSQNLYRWKAC